MPDLPTHRDFEDFAAWPGREVHGRDGLLGLVDAIFLDEETERPEWVLVDLEGGDGSAFVPLAGATVQDTVIRVEADREHAGGAPRLGEGDTLSVEEERRLYEHYGLAYSEEESSTVLPAGTSDDDAPEARDEPMPEVLASPDATPKPVPAAAKPRLRRFVDVPQPPSPAASPEAWAAAEKQAAPSRLSRVPRAALIGGGVAAAAAVGAAVVIVLRRRS